MAAFNELNYFTRFALKIPADITANQRLCWSSRCIEKTHGALLNTRLTVTVNLQNQVAINYYEVGYLWLPMGCTVNILFTTSIKLYGRNVTHTLLIIFIYSLLLDEKRE